MEDKINIPVRILVVEDNSDDEALLMRQLKKADLEGQVRVIKDGGAALEYLSDVSNRSENLAAVFLDFELPRVSGLQILEFIRSDPRTEHLRIVLMTSSNAPQVIERCRALNASFVPKPVTFKSFVMAVTETFSGELISVAA